MKRHPVRDVEAFGGADEDVILDPEVFHERIHDPLRHRVFDLQQRGRRMAELAQRPIDRLEQVVGVVVRHVHVGVSNHPEQVRADELHAGEQLAKVRANDVLEKSEGGARHARSPRGAGHRDEAREQRRELDARELVPASLANDHREVLAAIRDHGERVARIERQRCQQWKNLRPEI